MGGNAEGLALVSSTAPYLALTAIVVAAGVGVAEGIRTGQPGIIGLFGLVFVAALGLLPALRRARRSMLIRRDLVDWVAATSALTSESEADLVNRALSAFRAGVSDDRRG